jgi:hypothetical protein
LLALCARLLEPRAVRAVLEPTIADLQHEASEAGGNRRRLALACLRGYAAVARVVFTNSLLWRSPMRRLSTVFVLAWLGAALFYLPVAAHSNGPARLTPFLFMAIVTPVVLGRMKLAASFRQAFLSCLAVGMVMATGLFVLEVSRASASGASAPSWFSFVLTYIFLVGCVAMGSAIAAAAAISVPTNDGVQSSLRRVGACCIVYATLDGGVRLWSGAPVAHAVGWASFLTLYFGCVALLVYLPVLLGARRFLQRPPAVASTVRLNAPTVRLKATTVRLKADTTKTQAFVRTRRSGIGALLGGLLFPVPLLAFPLLQGRFDSAWTVWSRTPSALAWSAVPYLVAGALLGWLLAEHTDRKTSAVS